MLVLRRPPHDRRPIGDAIEITLVATGPEAALHGVEAPGDLKFCHRKAGTRLTTRTATMEKGATAKR